MSIFITALLLVSMILQQDYGSIRVRNNFEESGQYFNITSLTISNIQQVIWYK